MNTNDALAQVMTEYQSASATHDNFHSPHEGYAVLLEEVDELWDEVKKRHQSKTMMKDEAVQVAAMALRFLVDCC